jgi:hypothetical protein
MSTIFDTIIVPLLDRLDWFLKITLRVWYWF